MPLDENVKHGKYIVELTPVHSIYSKNGPPQIAAIGDKDLNGASFSPGYSYLSKPFLMMGDTHKHDFNQVVFFPGSITDNVTDFDAETEFTMDGEIILNYLPHQRVYHQTDTARPVEFQADYQTPGIYELYALYYRFCTSFPLSNGTKNLNW